jgi:glycosyltransferase involved in cell wall biosynthesis
MMRVLIVARYKNNGFAPFVTEQVEALEKTGVECRFYPVKKGYLKQWSALRRTIREKDPDIIHAHYGLCGAFANLQRRVPVVTTYHGSDINDPQVRWISRMAIRFSSANVFVSHKLMDIVAPIKNGVVIPCGIKLEDYSTIEKSEARKLMELDQDGKYILFAGSFDNPVKNAPLAMAAVSQLLGVQLLELKGYTRTQVAMLMQAVDALLMTSISEGSPQVIKEALACGCPIVSIDVGDVKDRLDGVAGCYLVEKDAEKIALALKDAMTFGKRTDGKAVIIRDGLTNDAIALRLKKIYQSVSKRG